MVVAQLMAQAAPALNATESTIHHCVSTTNYKTKINRDQEAKEKMMAPFGEKSVCYSIVIVKANGTQCRALGDTGPGSSYASVALINPIGTSPIIRDTRQIEISSYKRHNLIFK